ncbi:MAG: tetratricopeptide repeat protein [Candidatus Eiseniibacteriota bacterium]
MPEAHEAYLRGRYDLGKLSEAQYRAAIGEFQTALRIQPTYAPAWAGLADTYYFMSNVYLPPAEAMPKARAAAERAIALDGDQGNAHATLGMVTAQYDWKWEEAEREIRLALASNPSDANAHYYYSTVLTEIGRQQPALAEYQTALSLDPLSEYTAVTWLQPDYFFGHYDDAIARCTSLIESDPGYSPAYCLLGMCYAQQGRLPEAEQALRKASTLDLNPFALANLGNVLGRQGRRAEALAIATRLDSLDSRTHVSGYSHALVYVGVGDKNSAFSWLGRALENRDEDLCAINVDPAFRSLHGDPRFQSLVAKLGLAGEPVARAPARPPRAARVASRVHALPAPSALSAAW